MAHINKTHRRQERTVAFKALYSICFSPITSMEQLQDAFHSLPDKPEQAILAFAWDLVQGTWTQQQSIDTAISSFSQNWRIERMAKVELTILRLAMFELMFRPDIPARAAINEAIELSKQFGDDNSRSFVNGILDAAIKAVDTGKLVRQELA